MKLHHLLCAAAVLALAAPGAALAGPAYNWSGAYVGGQAGYGWSSTTSGPTTAFDDPEDAFVEDAFTYTGNGFIGGGEAGYNWQSGPLVVGVVGDISAANITGSVSNSTYNYTLSSTINWLSTARFNVGAPLGNLLVYGTGGIAFGNVSSTLNDNYPSDDTVITSNLSSNNVGWTVGAGIAAPVAHNWFVKAEYLYVDLGTQNYSLSEPDPGWAQINGSNHTTANIFRASVDYKF